MLFVSLSPRFNVILLRSAESVIFYVYGFQRFAKRWKESHRMMWMQQALRKWARFRAPSPQISINEFSCHCCSTSWLTPPPWTVGTASAGTASLCGGPLEKQSVQNAEKNGKASPKSIFSSGNAHVHMGSSLGLDSVVSLNRSSHIWKGPRTWSPLPRGHSGSAGMWVRGSRACKSWLPFLTGGRDMSIIYYKWGKGRNW